MHNREAGNRHKSGRCELGVNSAILGAYVVFFLPAFLYFPTIFPQVYVHFKTGAGWGGGGRAEHGGGRGPGLPDRRRDFILYNRTKVVRLSCVLPSQSLG